MKFIKKGDAEDSLLKQPTPKSYRKAKEAWARFKKKTVKRDATLNRCLSEQFHICAYSEVKLEKETLGYHIDHVVPRKVKPELTFDHNNLVVSAIDDAYVRNVISEEVFGGHSKGGWYLEKAFIHPLKANCSNYFKYDASSGLASPNDKLPRREQVKACLTIRKLNLNSDYLVPQRKNVLRSLNKEILNFLKNNPNELENFARKKLLPKNGHLDPFFSAKKQLFGRIGERVIEELYK